MSQRGQIGRADLARLCAGAEPDKRRDLAAVLGYQWLEVPAEEKPVAQEPEVHAGPSPRQGTSSAESPEITAAPLSDIPFWLPVRYEQVGDNERRKASEPPAPAGYPQWRERPATPPPFQPLAWWRELNMPLRHALGGERPGRDLDIDRIVARMGAGKALTRLPHKSDTHWSEHIQVIADRSRRLIPYSLDQRYVSTCLAREIRAGAVAWGSYSERRSQLVSFLDDGSEVDYRLPPPGTPVLVLGDLGALAKGGATQRFWREFGHRLRAANCKPVALFPAARHRCPEDLARLWNLVPWERPLPAALEPKCDPLDELMRLVAPVSRLEPGLLRAIRRLMPHGGEPGLEADLWQHPWLDSDSPAGGTIVAKHLATMRQDFAAQVPADLRARIAETVRSWRVTLPMEIWFDELLNLDSATQGTFAADRDDARQYMQAFLTEAGGQPAGSLHPRDMDWLARNRARASESYWRDPVIGQSMLKLDYALNHHRPDYVPPGGIDPAGLDAAPGATVTRLALVQDGETLRLDPAAPPGEGDRSRILADLRSINGVLTVTDAEAETAPFWASGTPPAWASAWGRDEFGAWVIFIVDGVTQRMRWCPPGTFLMGSPEDEPARWDDEGPQHTVTLTRGFWLFDTPCTQALWQAVMGDNPSYFISPDRPVETVGWEDVQKFLSRLNDRLPGLALSLPTEAQWEYACRADAAAPDDLDAVAWYRGNSGNATHPVALKAANAWGLHDMLGNVDEWCADGWGDYRPEPATDPHRSLDVIYSNEAEFSDGTVFFEHDGAFRVFRGGSWVDAARGARAARRGRIPAAGRNHGLGFRCARVQVSSESEGGAEPAVLANDRQAERRAAQGAAGAALGLLRAETARCALPRSGFRVLTDCERLTFDSVTKPDWASAIGRDRFGLWTEITVDKATQRLRWISPGRFLMGSPPDEPGRRNHEGPQHEVTLTKGFWLFDTPCTQALWQAVMGDKPSKFKSPDRPVEQVSWGDVQKFIAGLNDRVPGLTLSLPTEAQWEYACRAGTKTALYTGPIAIAGARDSALDPIAWYCERKTHPVKLKAPNSWGLYDMLGNVWEWCVDGWGAYGSEPTIDPQVSWKAGMNRVIRGGSWVNTADHERAAARNGPRPGARHTNLGFRCARVQ